jgi:DNA-binding transcriptional regulator LsrR (DeoR family)
VDQVVQVLGGSGEATAQAHATRLTGRLAQLTGATAIYLPAPGLVAASATRRALVEDGAIAAALEAADRLTVLLAGIGSLAPSPLLQASGNAISDREQTQLRERGAVGDVCMRFFDADGKPVKSDLDGRVVGIDGAAIRKIDRKVGVAGGARKHQAVRAALKGGWINVLITDLRCAEYLRNHA